MKALARGIVYWPGLDQQIENHVKQCKDCALVAKSPPHSPPEAWPAPAGPWQRLHIDYAGPINGLYFLLIIDAYSRWPEIYATTTTTAKVTIKLLRSSFSRLGLPTTLVSDNAAQFTSEEFEMFCKANGITHILTAPYHPQSNGQAERFVDSMKRAMKKINKGEALQETLEVFLTTYRSTPSPTTNFKSPSELMFGRSMRTTLDLLRPIENVAPESQSHQHREFSREDMVYAKVYKRNEWHWEPGKVIERMGAVNYNFWIEGQRTGLIRSHINQLRPRYAMHSGEPPTTCTGQLPLDILLGEFGLAQPIVVPTTAEVPSSPVSQASQQPSGNQADPSTVRQQPTQPPIEPATPAVTCTSRGRIIRLPPRFEPYDMS